MVKQVARLLHRPAAPSPLCMRPHLLQLSTEQEPQNGPNPFLLIPDNCCCLFELNNIGWTRRESKHWSFGKNLRFRYLLWHNPARICYPRSDSILRSKCCMSLSEWVSLSASVDLLATEDFDGQRPSTQKYGLDRPKRSIETIPLFDQLSLSQGHWPFKPL